MSGFASTTRTKVTSWLASIASPSSTHASGMLILFGLLAAATTDAQSVHQEPIRVHHPKSGGSQSAARAAGHLPPASKMPGTNPDGSSPEVQPVNNQEMLYYVAMGMLVSQGLIRLFTWYTGRREAAAALAARKKDDDLLEDDGSVSRKSKRAGLTLNALEGLDPETLKKRKEDLAALGETASLLGSDSEDDDYEESEEESSEEEEEEEEEEESEEEEELEEESESEGELERRRRVLATGDAEIEE